MSDYGIGLFNFEFWNGPAPIVNTNKVLTRHRPGSSGVAQQLIGNWGSTFDVVLVSHWIGQLEAADAARRMNLMIGAADSPYPLKYNGMNYTGLFGVAYNVDEIEVISIRSSLLLKGPTYSYVGGASLISRFTLTPQALY